MSEIIITENNFIQKIEISETGAPGLPGETSYQYAVRTGMFSGTEAEFYTATITDPIQAAASANAAAQNVGTAIDSANDAATAANAKATLANDAATAANAKATLANDAATAANAAASDATVAITATNAAKDAANDAATAANAKATLANDAATAANAKATLANDAATAANAKATLANDAATNATNAAANATAKAALADAAASSAAQFQNRQSQFFSPKQLIAWDNFDRADESPIVKSESGHIYSAWKGTNKGLITGKLFSSNSPNAFQESASTITITPTKNIGIEVSMQRLTTGQQAAGVAIVKDPLNYFFFGRSSGSHGNSIFPEIAISGSHQLIAVIGGVATVLGSFARDAIYSGGNGDPFQDSRMTFVLRYLNRGRTNSGILVQSLDKPDQRIDVDVTAYNSIFATPSDYNKIAIISNIGAKLMSFNVADLNI